MPDPRLDKLGNLLVNYSVGLKPRQRLFVLTTPQGAPLAREVYRHALLAGGHPEEVMIRLDEARELMLRHGNEEQLADVTPIGRLVYDTYDALIQIEAPANTRALTGSNPKRLAIMGKALAPLADRLNERTARGELQWSLVQCPTQASAQDASMSLSEYEDFVYKACLVDQPDPVGLWSAEGARQKKLVAYFQGKKAVHLKGPHADLRFSIAGRPFINSDGHFNLPDGEIFTSPVEDSAEGWIRFSYPVIYGGREVTDVELRFEKGRIVQEKAAKGQEMLTSMLDIDAGSRFLGEWGVGTNYAIQHFSRNMLFDEKLGGTIHLAVGFGFPEAGSVNKSGLHWDMLCDMRQAEIVVDGEVIYRNSNFIL
jgi:aminopeptidase